MIIISISLQVVVSLLEDSVPTKVLASLSRNNVPLSNNEDDVFPLQSLDILLKVPPNNAVPTDIYRLHVEVPISSTDYWTDLKS